MSVDCLGPLRGRLTVCVWHAHTRDLLARDAGDNLILNGARSSVVRQLGTGGTDRKVTHIGFGSRGDAPILSDAGLADEYRRLIVDVDYPQPAQVRFSWTLRDDEANGLAIMEFGLYTSDGTLFSRKVRGAPIHKTDAIYLTGDWLIEQS